MVANGVTHGVGREYAPLLRPGCYPIWRGDTATTGYTHTKKALPARRICRRSVPGPAPNDTPCSRCSHNFRIRQLDIPPGQPNLLAATGERPRHGPGEQASLPEGCSGGAG